ncbi:MAG: SBBP repeat-containing protein [Ignavibacteriaceae bacterium]|nr:SBBP repeat-containing protein [Ignavibacteriaceae bacterium]
MIKILAQLSIYFVFHSALIAQVSQQWLNPYYGSGSGNNYSYAIKLDNSGNVLVTGSVWTNFTNYEDFGTIKYSSEGTQLWPARRYNGTGSNYDHSRAIAIDANNNVYVTGESWGGSSLNDIAIVKYNPNGDTIWTRRFNSSINGNEYSNSIAVDQAGNVYVAGESSNTGTLQDFILLKHNSFGTLLWSHTYNGSANGNDEAVKVCIDNSGNAYVTGYVRETSSGPDIITIKYDSTGAEQWVRKYNGPGNDADYGRSIAIDLQGNVYVAGESVGIGSGFDYVLIKYNSAGQEQWVSRYNGTQNGNEFLTALYVDNYGQIYISGGSTGSKNAFDYATIKYSSLGDQLWSARYNGPKDSVDYSSALAVDTLGNVYVTGYSEGSSPTFAFDFATIKYNSDGFEQWIQRYNGQGSKNDYATGIAVDNSGGVYVTGYSVGTNNYHNFITIKYQQNTTDIISEKELQPKDFALIQNYPNPFNPSTKISWQSPVGSHQTLKVYDVLGNEVATLVDEYKTAGSYEVDFDAAGLSSGVYFYRLQSGSFVESRKMILIK